jgi:hypothetical protein
MRSARPQGGVTMPYQPVTHDSARSINSAYRDSDNAKSAANRLRAVIAGPNLFIILAFCAIGLLVTLNLLFHFPDFGFDVEQFSQF